MTKLDVEIGFIVNHKDNENRILGGLVMTKQEKDKCEKLLDEIVLSLDRSDSAWKSYEGKKRDGCYVDAEIRLRSFENHHGYAEGIYQALAVLGYKNEKMIEIGKRI